MIGHSTLNVGFQHAQNGVHTASALPALADYRGLFNHRLCQAPLYKFQEVCGTWYTSYVNTGIMLLGCSPFRDPELPPVGRGADLVSKSTRFRLEAEQLFRTSASLLIGQQVSWRTRRESYNKSPPNRGCCGLVFSRVVLQIGTR